MESSGPGPPENPAPPRIAKRPDRAQRRKKAKHFDERVVKCSLPGALLEKTLQPEIEKWVLTVSKITNRGSLIFNHLLLHCLTTNTALPDLTNLTLFVQIFNIGIGKLLKPNPLLETIWSLYFKDTFPIIQKCRGGLQAYTYAAKKYMTNFKNSIMFAFEGRQKAFLKHWSSQYNIVKEDTYAIRCAINGWECRRTVPETAKTFVKEQKQLLGTTNIDTPGITTFWLGDHIEQVLRYFYFILQYNEQFEDTRRFTLAPVSRIKRHFLTIDTRVFYEMMKNIGLINCNEKKFQEMKDEQFDSVFRVRHLSKGQFTYLLETDGVSVSVHFRTPRILPDKESPMTVNRQLPTRPGSQHLKATSGRVIAIDPGRSNLMFGVERLPDGNVKTYKLTRNQYYTEAGMKERNKKTKYWEAQIATEEELYARHSIKTTRQTEWEKFLKDYSSVYDTLWNAKTQKKWAREAFRVYCLRNSVLDRFFQSMNGEESPTIAYGAARFNPNNKNELSAPTTYLSKRCEKHHPTVFVDEFNTTKVCSHCNEKLYSVAIDGKEKRGLRWCCSTKCRSFRNRDLNAALNILRCFKSPTNRPSSLCRKYSIRESIQAEGNSKKKCLRLGNHLRCGHGDTTALCAIP